MRGSSVSVRRWRASQLDGAVFAFVAAFLLGVPGCGGSGTPEIIVTDEGADLSADTGLPDTVVPDTLRDVEETTGNDPGQDAPPDLPPDLPPLDVVEVSDLADVDACMPACEGRECGDNGCGGECGQCGEHQGCELGQCIDLPWCGNGECDPDSETCANCAEDCACETPAVCFQAACCTPADCTALDRECGDWDDGCGGQAKCGGCEVFPGSFCAADGRCDCATDCTNKACGDDGCGGQCGTCGALQACTAGFQCGPVGCTTDLTCLPYGGVCDPLSKTCVACLLAADCSEGSYICKERVCTPVDFCRSSLDCTGEVCDPSRGYCVPCVENADCGSNALCRDATCKPVTPCNSSLDCTNQVCNKTKGYCVNCIANADCGTNSECIDDACVPYTPCVTDLTCTPLGRLCDKAVGRCVRCLTDGECPEVYHCHDNDCLLDICVPGSGSCDGNVAVKCLANGSGFANPVACGATQYCDAGECHDWVCTPGVTACNGNVLETCNDLGSAVASARDCTASAVCLNSTCVPKVCAPLTFKCTTDFARARCNATGTAWEEETSCGESMYCDTGECYDWVCQPGFNVCNGNVRETCNAKGSGLAASEDCTDAAVCLNATCVPKVCGPLTFKCTTDFSRSQCNLHGTAWGSATGCGGGEYCDAGACKSQVCQPGTAACNGNLLETCNTIGSGIATSIDCTAAAVCLNATCVPKICTPFAWKCTTDFAHAQCNIYGTAWGDAEACPARDYCDGGTCKTQVCTPGDQYCLDTDTSAVCDGKGSGPALTVPCGTDETCLGGTCLPILCTPDTAVCSGNNRMVCDSSGTAYVSVACGATQYCDKGECKNQVCVPDAKTCHGNVLETCNANGSGLASSQDCTSSAVCLGSSCVPKICTPFDLRCDDDFSWSECNLHGTEWGAPTSCGTGQYCDVGVCREQVCVPNGSFCDGNVARVCDAIGASSTLVEDCSATTQDCMQGTCVARPCSAVKFNGSNIDRQRVDIAFPSELVGATTFTIEAWVNVASYTQYGHLFSALVGSDALGCLVLGDVGYGANRYKWGCMGVYSTTVIPLDQWQHVALQFSNGNYEFYLGGKFQGSKTAGYTTLPSPTMDYIGIGSDDTQFANSNPSLNGSVDEVRISRSRRYSEDFTPGLSFTPDSDTVALLHFSERTGTATADASGNDYNGTLRNGAVWANDSQDCSLVCGGVTCPVIGGYKASCNAQNHCEYANPDTTGWKAHDIWIWIPPGSFAMGSPPNEASRRANEGPQHTVTVGVGYLVQKHQLTVSQYEACRAASPGTCSAIVPDTTDWGANTSSNGRSDHPQNDLNWAQAQAACTWLGGRLPSEAEWEYASSGPTHRKYPWGDTPEPTCSNNTAVFDDTVYGTRPWGCNSCTTAACSGTSPVGSKTAGASWSGVLDMSGNVWEWVLDSGHDSYTGAPSDGSAWIDSAASTRMVRGGGYGNTAVEMRTASRAGTSPTEHGANQGARCVRDLPVSCGGIACPLLGGYKVSCNAQDHCEYTNFDTSGWKQHDVWIWIPPGSFPMGSPSAEGGHQAAEEPVHVVTFATGYLIQKYELTVAQYEACQSASPGTCTAASTADWNGDGWGTNTSANGRSDHPQNGLTWIQASEACSWMGGRLPSEAEWEYAATGPIHRKYPWGDTPEPTCANDTAVFDDGTAGSKPWGCDPCVATGCSGTSPVGSKPGGASWSGALDMAGNVWEACEDWYHDGYNSAPLDGSAWVNPVGTYRAVRGYSFNGDSLYLRSSGRGYASPSRRDVTYGARCVRDLVTSTCAANHRKACCGDAICWFDSCGVQGDQVEVCPLGCSNGACQLVAWQTLLAEDFNDGVADGWELKNGCAGSGCPLIQNKKYYFKGDWNAVTLPAVTNSGATADAFEFTLERQTGFGALCFQHQYALNSELVCVRHVSNQNKPVVNDVWGGGSSLAAPMLATLGTNIWRIERDLGSGICSVAVDGITLGSVPCRTNLPSRFVIWVVSDISRSANSYIDNVKLQALW